MGGYFNPKLLEFKVILILNSVKKWEEIFEWTNKHFEYGTVSTPAIAGDAFHFGPETLVYRFKYENDAVLFKLTWA